MFVGDIFSCQKNMSMLLKQKPSVDEKTIDEIGTMLVKFSKDSFIPVEYSEKILTSTGNLMERCSQHDTLERFAANSTFTNALVSIICDFGTRISVDSGNISPSSFSSHYCYELSLFMLLGLLDKSPILKIFVRVTDETVVTKLMKSLCATIAKDYAYLTQEVGLEVVSRLSHYYLQQDPEAFERVSIGISPSIKDVISDPVRIPQLLRDMRPLLNNINASNPNVFSMAVAMFRIGTSWKKIDTVRDVHHNGWLDLCKNDICYNLLEEEVLIRFDYQAIKKVHFSIETNSVQILLYTCPKKLRELLKKEEIPPPSHCPVLMFEFSGSTKAIEDVKCIMEIRMIEHETVKLDGKKYSVVSSRQQSPEAAVQAAERLKKTQLKHESKDETDNKSGAEVLNGASHFVSPKSGSTPKRTKTSTGSKKKKSSNVKQKPKSGKPLEETPSSISSPDMEVPSVDSSQLDLPDHKEGPDTLVHLYDQKRTPAPAQPSAAGRATKTKPGSRKRGATAGEDILARLEPPTKRSSTMGRPKAVPFEHTEVEISFPTRKQGTGTKNTVAKTQISSGKKSGRLPRKSIAKTLPRLDVPAPDEAYAGDYDDGFGHYNYESPIGSPAREATKDTALASDKKFGTKSGRAPLQPLTETATNVRNAAPTTSTLTTPKSALPTKGAKMRASTTRAITGMVDHADKIAPAPEESDKENIDVPGLQDSPPVSQAGTHNSKRKFGRTIPIKPLEASKIDWTAMEEPPASTEKERLRNQRIEDAARAKEKASEKRRQRSLSDSVQKGKKGDGHPPPLPLSKASTIKGHSTDSITGGLLPTSTTPKMTASHRGSNKGAPLVVSTTTTTRGEDKDGAEKWEEAYLDGGDVDTSYDHGFMEGQDRAVEPAKPLESEIQPVSKIVAAPQGGYSWRQTVPPLFEDSHRPLSGLAAKLQATRAELAHEVAANTAVADLIVPEVEQEEEAPISIPTFTQGLTAGRPVSQVSHTSRTSGSQYAPSLYLSSAEEYDAPRGLDVDDPFSCPRGRTRKAAVRSNTRGRKRKAKETYSDEEESENESVAVEEERNGSTPSSSSGDNGIVAALLREIVMMQKERAKRKRARMLSNVGQTARVQVVGFLDQWRTFTEHSAAELKRSANMQLENLCASADTLCEALGKDVELYTQREQEQTRDLQGLERDVTALKTEISTAVSQCRSEEASLRTEIMGLKNRALDTAKKTMSMHKDSKQLTSKHQNKELLDALKQM